MSNPQLAAAQLGRVRRELPQIESTIRALITDTQFMLASKDNFDARQLLERANQSTILANQLRERLGRLMVEAQSAARSFPRRPSASHQSAPFTNSADISAFMRRLPESMTTLQHLLQSFTAESRQRIGAPGRWGDLMAEGSGVQLWWSSMNTLLEWWKAERERQKVARHR